MSSWLKEIEVTTRPKSHIQRCAQMVCYVNRRNFPHGVLSLVFKAGEEGSCCAFSFERNAWKGGQVQFGNALLLARGALFSAPLLKIEQAAEVAVRFHPPTLAGREQRDAQVL